MIVLSGASGCCLFLLRFCVRSVTDDALRGHEVKFGIYTNLGTADCSDQEQAPFGRRRKESISWKLNSQIYVLLMKLKKDKEQWPRG